MTVIMRMRIIQKTFSKMQKEKNTSERYYALIDLKLDSNHMSIQKTP